MTEIEKKEHRKIYMKKYQQRNKEKLAAYTKEYRQQNPEKVKQWAANYWRRRLGDALNQGGTEQQEQDN